MVGAILVAIFFWAIVIGLIVWAILRATKTPKIPPAYPSKEIKTSISRANLVQRISAYFGPTGYSISSQSENTVVLQDGKDMDGCLFVLLIVLLAIGALIYYLAAKSHQIVVTWENRDGLLYVSATGNTYKAQQQASVFLDSLG
jgi:uncharacterized membrane protein YagU involved in acid resistance